MKMAGIVIGLMAAILLPNAEPSAAKDVAPGAPKLATAKAAAKKTPAASPTAKDKDDPDGPVENISPPSEGALKSVGWRIVDDLITGARLGLPSALVPKSVFARTGSRWTSGKGQIDIETFRLREAALPALFDDEKKVRHRTVEHSTLTPDSFVMSGMQGLKRFVVRVQANGNELRGITILYDQATEGMMAPIAAQMASTFQGFPDRTAALPPGAKRSVEYGTAIVVSAHGDLLTAARNADDCQSITVAGLGHAERVAVDKTDNVALIRLYGAQNLVPAALGGDGASGDDLALVGIADPLAQAGGRAVARAAVRRAAQNLNPAPQPGFAGAAAVDGQGRFAGMVDVQSALVAGPGGTAAQATLIPAETLRAFLQAQNIAPAAGNAAIDRSVMRVICVRK
jgi:hypothetical protein